MLAASFIVLLIPLTARSQQRPATPQRRGARGPAVISPQVGPDRRVTFRVLAPHAQEVRLSGGDIPGGGPRTFAKNDEGVFELTLGPIDPGAYRYTFNIDGVATVDPASPSISESNNNAWSVVYVPGSEISDETDVPHGAVAAVHYHSSSLGRDRRMHVYTPPGYESGSDRYPVFYLLHGASDSDDSWVSVGRANFILENLIAAKKARPMIVVMPAGHTGRFSFGGPPAPRPVGAAGEFENDFVHDILPYVESHYRVIADRSHRAIAGLSMGGAQTLNLALSNPKDFAYVGVFSSGLFGRNSGDWEKEHQAQLDDASAKEGLRLFWFKTGKDDRLMPTTKRTVEMLQNHGFKIVSGESDGGHTWINWRNYLSEFAPQLFQ